MIYKNGEGYPDLTAGVAIREADKPPAQITWFVKTIRDMARLFDLEIVGKVQVKDKKTGREYR